VTGDRKKRIFGFALAEIISDAGAFVLPFFRQRQECVIPDLIFKIFDLWQHPGEKYQN
jgi:hypothetical protein